MYKNVSKALGNQCLYTTNLIVHLNVLKVVVQ